MTLEPGDVMAIEFEHSTELVIDVTIARSRRGDLDAWSHAPRSSAARRSEAQRRQRMATTESRRLISRGDRILEIAADGPSGSSDDAIGRRNKPQRGGDDRRSGAPRADLREFSAAHSRCAARRLEPSTSKADSANASHSDPPHGSRRKQGPRAHPSSHGLNRTTTVSRAPWLPRAGCGRRAGGRSGWRVRKEPDFGRCSGLFAADWYGSERISPGEGRFREGFAMRR